MQFQNWNLIHSTQWVEYYNAFFSKVNILDRNTTKPNNKGFNLTIFRTSSDQSLGSISPVSTHSQRWRRFGIRVGNRGKRIVNWRNFRKENKMAASERRVYKSTSFYTFPVKNANWNKALGKMRKESWTMSRIASEYRLSVCEYRLVSQIY